ncbi:uncharacterized protein [Medicago truncatula]|uniref:uncharacterized protein n=1 Tax=Medicago truncatula TaxID=3880 RepID=UPI000D2F3DE9|nr:uncharacterized protein LOC25498694 [Medicago truncatula]
MVDGKRNKVVYAEAGKDFVDALFSFLTLPLGTIARLAAKQSNIGAVTVGSLSSLHQSVADLDEQYLWTHACKEMLLKPRNSMEVYSQNMKLNIDDTEPMNYFLCQNRSCYCSSISGFLSTFRNQNCSCGRVMDRVVIPGSGLIQENGYVKETATFIICDDLYVMPNVLDLLKLSILSNTPSTDFIFGNNNQFLHSNLRHQSEFVIGDVSPYEFRQMSVKVLVRRSTREVLYAEAEEDFADFLLSFLTFPLGGVLHMLQGFSSISCIDNLYTSMTALSSDRYLMSQDLKNKLVKPLCAAQFELRNQILPISAVSLPLYYCHTYQLNGVHGLRGPVPGTLTSTPKYMNDCITQQNTQLSFVDPKFCMSKSSNSGEYARGPSMFMVTDDLAVTPMSSVTALSYLISSNVPLSDLEEMVIRIGVTEGLSILKASLISTNGLSQIIRTNLVEL